MKKFVTLSVLSVAIILLSGCGHKQTNQPQPSKSADTGKEGVYTNSKYNFSISYPAEWKVDEDNALAGPGFRPNSLSMQDIKKGKINKDKDCFFMLAFLSATQDKKIPCKNNVGEVTLGSNSFTKCNAAGMKYMILHPKAGNVLSFEYLDNPACKALLEKSLETLRFN